MRGSRTCEKLGWRLAWLARTAGRTEVDKVTPLPTGTIWQELVLETARATRPYLDIQGPGRGRLFGSYGASGMPAEIDTAVDDGGGIVTIIESKAVDDYGLRRDEAWIFSGRVRDHEASPSFRWQGAQALIASVGRLDAIFCRWCFYEGIDVVDPDRFPLTVLARLPYVLSDSEFALLQDHYPYDWLRDVLQMTHDEIVAGPMLLRRPARRGKLVAAVLDDLNEIQARLSESVWSMLLSAVPNGTREERQATLLARARNEFQRLGITIPALTMKPPGGSTGGPSPIATASMAATGDPS